MEITVRTTYLDPILLDTYEWVSVRLPDGREITVFADKVYVSTEQDRLDHKDGQLVWSSEREQKATQEAVAELDALNGDNQGSDHSAADDVLLRFVPEQVRVAWQAAHERVGFRYS